MKGCMKHTFMWCLVMLALVGASLALGSKYYYYSPFHPALTKAIAVVTPTKGNTASGVVYFTQEKQGIHITAHLSGLTPGEHGFHIHEFGNCACDDAVCAGAHFDPTRQPHGGPTSEKRHVGDLGNIVADEQGNAQYDYTDTQIALNGPHSILGRAVIVHAQPDDLVSQPSGNAGARVGCGVVGIAGK
jgi:Cu-Zn family superoxide dismutase